MLLWEIYGGTLWDGFLWLLFISFESNFAPVFNINESFIQTDSQMTQKSWYQSSLQQDSHFID